MAVIIRLGEFESLTIGTTCLLTVIAISSGIVELRANFVTGEEFEFAVVVGDSCQQVVNVSKIKGFSITANDSAYGRVAIYVHAMHLVDGKWTEVVGKCSIKFLPVSRFED